MELVVARHGAEGKHPLRDTPGSGCDDRVRTQKPQGVGLDPEEHEGGYIERVGGRCVNSTLNKAEGEGCNRCSG
jgi:hypothetical protein